MTTIIHVLRYSVTECDKPQNRDTVITPTYEQFSGGCNIKINFSTPRNKLFSFVKVKTFFLKKLTDRQRANKFKTKDDFVKNFSKGPFTNTCKGGLVQNGAFEILEV